MRPHGKVFVGSNGMFETQQFLSKGNVASNALWLPHFTPVKTDHLRFETQLLKTFCSLNICCSCVGTFPSYIAGVLGTNFVDTLRISQLCIARTDSPILDKIYRIFPTFEVEHFGFRMSEQKDIRVYPTIRCMILHTNVCDSSFFYFHCQRVCALRIPI